MLTARDALAEKLEGLRAGADDYAAKPFAFEELLARIEVLLAAARLGTFAEDARLQRCDYRPVAKTARRAGRDLGLTATEFGLLRYLVENADRVVSRMEILNAVWGYDFDPNTNIVEVYIAYLRKKIERDTGSRLIRNVRGFGYQISAADPSSHRRA